MISIHALCEEGDPRRFNDGQAPQISIHALCEEGDLIRPILDAFADFDFYPRPLRGGRQSGAVVCRLRFQFLSTPSARRATVIISSGAAGEIISIHALCEEGDLRSCGPPGRVKISIHALCEEGDTDRLRIGGPACGISIHALCEEGDLSDFRRGRLQLRYFYPRPLRGGRRGP